MRFREPIDNVTRSRKERAKPRPCPTQHSITDCRCRQVFGQAVDENRCEVAHPGTALDDGGTFVDAQTAKPLTFPRRAPALAIRGNVLVDAFQADRHPVRPDNLLGTTILAQARLDGCPRRGVDARQRTGGMAALRGLALCVSLIVAITLRGIAMRLPADRAGARRSSGRIASSDQPPFRNH